MKILKKMSAAVLAALLALSMSVIAFAVENTTITLPDTTGHTYEVYQIFIGDLSTNAKGEKVLSNVKWGENGTGTKGTSVDSDTLKKLSAVKESAPDAEKLETITKYVKLDSKPYTTGTSGQVLENIPTGYYLIKDVDGSLANKDEDESLAGKKDQNDAYSLYMVKVVGPVELKAKSSVPSVEKKVKDKNDSDKDEFSDWKDSADHDIGDDVPFQLTGTLPDNYDVYKTYYYEFHDTLSVGLTYKNDAKVYIVNGKTGSEATKQEVTKQFTITEKDGNLSIKCDDLKKITEDDEGKEVTITKDSKIVVEYTAVLNDKAEIGSKGNPNKVYLEFSNNPNKGGDGDKGKTPEDTVIVFTYKLIVNKVEIVDEIVNGEEKPQEKPLTGAGFTLYKYDAKSGEFVAVGKELKGEAMTQFTWTGLDDGIYKLSETTVPNGYNAINDIYFKVEASHTDGDTPKLDGLKIAQIGVADVGKMTNTSESESENGNVYSVSGVNLTDGTLSDIAFTCTTDGTMSTTIVNQSGVTLPSTGGMGTTLLYIIGSVLVVTAGVLLIVKKRMQ